MRRLCWLGFLLCLAGCGTAGQSTGPSASRLREWASLLRSGDAGARLQARWRLAQAGRPAVPHLTAALEDGEAEVRLEAAAALGGMHGGGGPEAVHALTRAARHTDPDTQRAALEALGTYGRAAAEAVPAVRQALNHGQERVRGWAAVTLARILGADAVPELVAALGKGGRRLEAAVALRELGPAARPAVPALHALLQDGNTVEREAAADALQAIAPGGRAVTAAAPWPAVPTR